MAVEVRLSFLAISCGLSPLNRHSIVLQALRTDRMNGQIPKKILLTVIAPQCSAVILSVLEQKKSLA